MAVQAPPQSPTERSAVDLARAIRSGETSSREVVEAHIERLRRTHERINVVVADRYDAARAALELERAHGGWVPPREPRR
ncbi:MAG: hypothetical protein ACR2LK_05910 [Solirubrobacteraceae bacterium]